MTCIRHGFKFCECNYNSNYVKINKLMYKYEKYMFYQKEKRKNYDCYRIK